MIAPILFLLAALAVMSTTLISGQLSSERASARLRLAHAAEDALSLAESQLLSALQDSVVTNLDAGRTASAGIDGSYVRRTPLTALAGTRLSYASYEQIDGATTQSGNNDVAQNVQTSSLGQEQRLSAVLSIELHGAAPAYALLAKRSRLLTLRIFSAEPYAIVDATRDLATAEDATGAAEGDPAGRPAAPGDATTPDPAQPDSYHDTTIKVRHRCAGPDTGGVDPGTFGYQWGNGGSPAIDSLCAPTAPPWATSPAPPAPGDGDAFATRQWANSNANQSGWTR
jgi:hypothetical protein